MTTTFDNKQFNREEREREQRNMNKQALVGAKAIAKINQPTYKWKELNEIDKDNYFRMAKACIRAADKVWI